MEQARAQLCYGALFVICRWLSGQFFFENPRLLPLPRRGQEGPKEPVAISAARGEVSGPKQSSTYCGLALLDVERYRVPTACR
eukprot:11527050-Alexandrium_andersonii.AAC.1